MLNAVNTAMHCWLLMLCVVPLLGALAGVEVPLLRSAVVLIVYGI